MQQRQVFHVDNSIVKSALHLTKSILSRNGARAAGTSACIGAAEDIANQLRSNCHNVMKERFNHHPNSLWMMGKIVAVSFLLIAIFLNVGGYLYIPALMVSLLTLVYIGIHYFASGSLFDGLFFKAEGMNVLGTIEPNKAATQQILIMAHIDSAHVFGFLSKFKKLAGIRILLAIVVYFLITALTIFAFAKLVVSIDVQLETVIRISTVLGILFLLPLYTFISAKISPGAGDNLIGCAICAQLSKLFAQRVADGEALAHTRLVFLCTDAEEAGLRGSADYVRRHRQELSAIKTSVINLDSLYSLSDLTLMKSDSHGFVKLSKGLAASLGSLSRELGYDVKVRDLPFGGGSTDAASFARAGVDAISIVAMPTSLFDKQQSYHTMEDTIEKIELEVVEAVLNIVANYIIQQDSID